MPTPHLAKWTEANGLIFISGQLAYDEARQIVGEGIEAQTERALANLEGVLRHAGVERSNVLKTTIWLRTSADFATFNATYAAFFGDHRPARSTLVADLVAPRALVEIEAVAARPS
jgi:2-iminobutanoate/2-iminopropanoate deaminase